MGGEGHEKVQNYFYEPLTWDEVLLFGCDGEKKEGRMSAIYTASLYMTEHDWRCVEAEQRDAPASE